MLIFFFLIYLPDKFHVHVNFGRILGQVFALELDYRAVFFLFHFQKNGHEWFRRNRF